MARRLCDIGPISVLALPVSAPAQSPWINVTSEQTAKLRTGRFGGMRHRGGVTFDVPKEGVR